MERQNDLSHQNWSSVAIVRIGKRCSKTPLTIEIIRDGSPHKLKHRTLVPIAAVAHFAFAEGVLVMLASAATASTNCSSCSLANSIFYRECYSAHLLS